MTTGQVWRLRAWDDAGLEVEWHERGLISVSNDEIGDLTYWPPEADLRDRLTDHFDDRRPAAISRFVTYWRYFRVEMRPGDLVAVPESNRTYAVARVEGDYMYTGDEPDPRLRHRRSVNWLRTGRRAELDDDLRKVLNSPGTVCRVKGSNAVTRLMD